MRPCLRPIPGLAFAALAALLGAGCDVGFVAVEDPPEATTVLFRSDHAERFLVSLTLVLPASAVPATVIAGGTVVPVDDRLGDGRLHRRTIEADSLDPTIDLFIEPASGSRVDLDVPLIARSGVATRSDGLLRIPLRFGAGTDSVAQSWRVTFRDGDGARLLVVGSADLPSPIPPTLPTTLVPEAAVGAEFQSVQEYRFDDGGDAVVVIVRSRILFAIPSSNGALRAP